MRLRAALLAAALALSVTAGFAPAAQAATVVTSCTWQGGGISWDFLNGAVRYVGQPGAQPSFCLRDTRAKSPHRLVYQSDNNLVLYGASTSGGCVLWSSGTYGAGLSKLAFQTDGNVVLYRTSGNGGVLWASHTVDNIFGLNYQVTTNTAAPYQLYWWVNRTSPSFLSLARFGSGCH